MFLFQAQSTMASVLRSTTLLTRAMRRSRIPTLSYQPARFASSQSSYGNSESGHPKSDAPNPQVHQEHPGPEAPADKGTADSSSSSPSEGSESTPSKSHSGSERSASDKSKDKHTSSGARPALHNPDDAADLDDPEVKKHNEDMRNRAEQTPNQVK